MLSNITKAMNGYIDFIDKLQQENAAKIKLINSEYAGDRLVKETSAAKKEFLELAAGAQNRLIDECGAYIKAAHAAIDKVVNAEIAADFTQKIAALTLAADAGALTPAQIIAVLDNTPQYLAKNAILALAHKNNMLMDKNFYPIDAIHNAVDKVADNVQQLAALAPVETNNMHAALLANDASIAGANNIINSFTAGDYEMTAAE